MPEGVALGSLPRRLERLGADSSVGVCRTLEVFRFGGGGSCLVSGSSVSVRGLTSRSGRVGLDGRGCPGRRGVLFHGVDEPELRMV
jgi:hypothetical protein